MFERKTDWGPLDFRWSCTINLIYPIENIRSAPRNLDDEQALAAIRSIERPDGGGLGCELINAEIPASPETAVADRITFLSVETDRQRRQLVRAEVQLPQMRRGDLITRLLDLWKVDVVPGPPVRTEFMPDPDARRNILGSHHQETSFTVSHPRMHITREYGEAVGLDAAWNAMFQACPSERFAYAFSETGLISRTKQDDRLKLDLDRARARSEECWSRSRISVSRQTLTIGHIPNKTLFAQIKARQEALLLGKKNNVQVDFTNLLPATEQHILAYHPDGMEREAERFRIVVDWMAANDAHFSIRDTGDRVNVFFKGSPIGNWTRQDGRFTFDPRQDGLSIRSSGLITPKITVEEINTGIAAMILDAITAREIADPNSELKSWLGPLAYDFSDAKALLRDQKLIGGVPVQVY